MQLQVNDIWTKRERDGRLALFIYEDVLIDNIKGLGEQYLRIRARLNFRKTVSKRCLSQKVMPDTGALWRYAERKDGFYYDYDRIPPARQKQLPSKEEIIALHDQREAKAEQTKMLDRIKTYLKDTAQYLPAYGECTEIQANNLANACAVIQYAADVIRRQPPTSCNDFYRNLAEIITASSWSYLPRNYRVLKRKIVLVVDGADVRNVISLPRQGVQNRKPYSDQTVINWLLHLRSLGQNYPNAYIQRQVIKMCDLRGRTAPSVSWMEMYLAKQKTKFLTAGKRYGSGRNGADFRSYLPVADALHAGDAWQMDGTRVNLIPHKSSDGKHRSLMIISVYDVYSGDMIGYHFDTKEDRYGYLAALEMAVRNTGHLPYELVHDRFPGHNTEEWNVLTNRLNHVGVKTTVTSTGTGKALVERSFQTLQSVFMVKSPYYYGEGVQSKRANAHRSPEYLAKAKKEARNAGFDFTMACRVSTEIVEDYRTTKYSEYSRKRAKVEQSPMELYAESKHPNTYEIDDFRRVELFGTERMVTIRNQGLIRVTIQHVKLTYRVPDYEVISNYEQVAMCYDLDDLTSIHLFVPGDGANRQYLGEAKEEKAVQYYGPDTDGERIGKMKAARKKVEDRRKAELAAASEEVADEVELLMTVVNKKTTTDSAQDNWINERMKTRNADGQATLPAEVMVAESPRKQRKQTADPLRIKRDY